jgi:DNA adenine methylase
MSLFPNLEKFHDIKRALKNSELFWCDFAHLCRLAGPGDVLYLDPPYDDSYDQYTADGFKAEDQERLADEVWDAVDAGAIVFVHNSATDRVRDLYDGLQFIETAEKRQINSDTKGRHRVPCWLITNRPDMVSPQ